MHRFKSLSEREEKRDMEANSGLILSPMREDGFKDRILDILTPQSGSCQNDYFTTIHLQSPPLKILSSAACEKLGNELHKATSEQTLVDIPTASLMRLQGTCIEAMNALRIVREFEPMLNETTLYLDILSSIRIALLVVSLRPDLLGLQSEDVLRLSLQVLSSILFEATSDFYTHEARNIANLTIKALHSIVTKIRLHLVLSELEELVLRIVQPSSRVSVSGKRTQHTNPLEGSAMELISSIFLYYPEERDALIASVVSLTLEEGQTRNSCQKMSRNKESTRTSTVLFVHFVHLYTLPFETSLSDLDDAPEQHGSMEDSLVAATTCAQHIVSSLLAIDQNSQSGHSTMGIFCENLVQLVRSPQGIGAEVLLRCLLHDTLKVVNGCDRRLFALQLLKTMGEAIACLYADVQDAAAAEQINDLYGQTGVFRNVLDHLRWYARQDIHTSAARAYLLAAYACNVMKDNSTTEEERRDFKRWLVKAIDGPPSGDPFLETSSCHQVYQGQGGTAYLIILLSTEFFRGLGQIVFVIRAGLANDSVPIRLNCWKGWLAILGKNTKILRQSKGVVAGCLGDPSAKVREAAIVSLQENDAWTASLVENAGKGMSDKSPAIRKRFIRILEKSYIAQSPTTPDAACHMLRGVVDNNSSVAAAAQKALERLWLLSGRNDVHEEQLEDTLHTIFLIIQRYPGLESSLCKFFAFDRQGADFATCQLLVAVALRKATMSMGAGVEGQTLCTLAVFAKANGYLFTNPPYPLLQAYLSQSSMETDDMSFAYVASIFVQVVKCNPDFDTGFLIDLENTLLRLLTICRDDIKREHVTKCLWTVSDRLRTYPRLFKLVASLKELIARLDLEDSTEPLQGAALVKARRSIKLTGLIGKYFFHNGGDKAYSELHFSIVPRLSQIFKRRSKSLSHLALQSMCKFFHACPSCIIDNEMSSLCREVLTGEDENFQVTVIEVLLELLLSRERDRLLYVDVEQRSEAEYDLRDQIAHLTTESHLSSILALAMQGHSRRTRVTTRYIVTVSRQGLVCPSRVYPILVALGTSQDTETAQLANREHIRIYARSQSTVETSCIAVFRQSFLYQQRSSWSTSGVTSDLHAKLCCMFQVINRGQKSLRKAFLRQVCSELAIATEDAQNVLYVRYIAENLAFYAFEHPEELNQSISLLRQIVTVQQPVLEHGIQDILDRCANTDCLGLISSACECYVATFMVWECYSFLKDELTVARHTKDFNGAILRYHRDSGNILLESVEKQLLCLKDYGTMLARCQSFIEHGFLNSTA